MISGRFFVACSCTVWLTALAGCQSDDSGNHPRVVRATGKVLYLGQPIEGADVTFNNIEAKSTGTAKTDAAGRFTLSTFGKHDGVVPGKQAVAIRRVDVIDKTPKDVDVSAGGKALPPEIHWIIPERYSNASTSGLTADVTEGEANDFTFDLK
jgi:hypothetical protein